MIEAKNLSKKFADIVALDDVNVSIPDAGVFGLIGTNGAGKSTFLKLASGILKADKGSICIDGEEVFENIKIKEKFFYISDSQYFLPNSDIKDMISFYSSVYKNFDIKKSLDLLDAFDLNPKRRISSFSKGMKKQLSIILAISANTKYIFCDETFDGLDPVMREAVKKLFIAGIEDRGLTPIIASHNLRELEDISEHIGLLHKGGVLLSKDIAQMKLNIHKLQVVFSNNKDIREIQDLDIVQTKKVGSMNTFTVRGNLDEIKQKIENYEPLFYEIIPLSLEEIFISETEVKGYDIKKLIF